jgi:[ribosomal protein S5]-alanine N-acetyltransferase
MKLNLSPFPVLISDRLVLKQLALKDYKAIFKLRSDDKINEFIGRKKAKTIKEAQDFIFKINENIANNTSIYWGIYLNNSEDLIGTICFWNLDLKNDIAEIGYELLVDYQRKGLMQEAILTVTNYAFSIGFKTITACPNALNIASIKLLEKCHFKLNTAIENSDELNYALVK